MKVQCPYYPECDTELVVTETLDYAEKLGFALTIMNQHVERMHDGTSNRGDQGVPRSGRIQSSPTSTQAETSETPESEAKE